MGKRDAIGLIAKKQGEEEDESRDINVLYFYGPKTKLKQTYIGL